MTRGRKREERRAEQEKGAWQIAPRTPARQPLFSRQFLDEIEDLALDNAIRHRGENRLQGVWELRTKLHEEYQELAVTDAADMWGELADVTYYTVQLAIQGDVSMQHLFEVTLKTRQISIEQAEAACLAKYRYRAGHQRDIEAEKEAIQDALQALAAPSF